MPICPCEQPMGECPETGHIEGSLSRVVHSTDCDCPPSFGQWLAEQASVADPVGHLALDWIYEKTPEEIRDACESTVELELLKENASDGAWEAFHLAVADYRLTYKESK